jgi:hypothetical protein
MIDRRLQVAGLRLRKQKQALVRVDVILGHGCALFV